MLEDVLESSFLYHCYFGFTYPYAITKFKHVTSMYYQSWYLVLEFTFNVTYFHKVIDM